MSVTIPCPMNGQRFKECCDRKGAHDDRRGYADTRIRYREGRVLTQPSANHPGKPSRSHACDSECRNFDRCVQQDPMYLRQWCNPQHCAERIAIDAEQKQTGETSSRQTCNYKHAHRPRILAGNRHCFLPHGVHVSRRQVSLGQAPTRAYRHGKDRQVQEDHYARRELPNHRWPNRQPMKVPTPVIGMNSNAYPQELPPTYLTTIGNKIATITAITTA